MEHGNPSRAAVSAQYSSVGQNLFMVTITDPEIEYLLDSWFDEKDYYTYDTRTCESGKVCGHYTQVSRQLMSVCLSVCVCLCMYLCMCVGMHIVLYL